MVETIFSGMDGRVLVVPFKCVAGDDWMYMYSEEYRGEDFNIYQCMSGEVVAVQCSEIERECNR